MAVQSLQLTIDSLSVMAVQSLLLVNHGQPNGYGGTELTADNWQPINYGGTELIAGHQVTA